MEDIDTTSVEEFVGPFLPRTQRELFITATWAQSLDGRIAAAPGERTRLSGMYSKKMTHYLRSKHDAILVGRQTVAADNPRLDCRYSEGSSSPRPVILDSKLSWDLADAESWVVLERSRLPGRKAPWVVVDSEVSAEKEQILRSYGGDIVRVSSTRDWRAVSEALASRGVRSLMVEGGAEVLDSCLASGLADAVIITVAPTFLGRAGVDAAPRRAPELADEKWWTHEGVPDAVLAARAKR